MTVNNSLVKNMSTPPHCVNDGNYRYSLLSLSPFYVSLSLILAEIFAKKVFTAQPVKEDQKTRSLSRINLSTDRLTSHAASLANARQDSEIACLAIPHKPQRFQIEKLYLPRNSNESDVGWPTLGGPRSILHGMQKGWIVSTGSFRSFVDLMLAPESCEGLIIRDVTPAIYNHMTMQIILLRISGSISWFNHFQRELNKLVSRLREKSEKSDPNQFIDWSILSEIIYCVEKEWSIPTDMRNHYLEFLRKIDKQEGGSDPLLFLEFDLPKNDPYYRDLDYTQHCELFNKLQKFAKAGKIIPTIGSIDDLEEFKPLGINISFIDVSNIPKFTPLNFYLNHLAKNVSVMNTTCWTQGGALWQKTWETPNEIETFGRELTNMYLNLVSTEWEEKTAKATLIKAAERTNN